MWYPLSGSRRGAPGTFALRSHPTRTNPGPARGQLLRVFRPTLPPRRSRPGKVPQTQNLQASFVGPCVFVFQTQGEWVGPLLSSPFCLLFLGAYLFKCTHTSVCLCVSAAQSARTALFLMGLSLHMCSEARAVGLGPGPVVTMGRSPGPLLKITSGFAFCVIVCLPLLFLVLGFGPYHPSNPKLMTLNQK